MFPDQLNCRITDATIELPHFIKLLLLKRPLLRDFYAQTCRIEKWSVRELECRIDSMQFERTAYKGDQVFQVPQIQRDHLSWQGEPGYFLA